MKAKKKKKTAASAEAGGKKTRTMKVEKTKTAESTAAAGKKKTKTTKVSKKKTAKSAEAAGKKARTAKVKKSKTAESTAAGGKKTKTTKVSKKKTAKSAEAAGKKARTAKVEKTKTAKSTEAAGKKAKATKIGKKKTAGAAKSAKRPGTSASKTASIPRRDPARRRRGQLAAEKARFDLGPAAKVLVDELGQLPPGYGLTIVRGFVRDPHHVVAVWDVNDAAAVELAEERGWHSLQLRVETDAGEELARATVGRRSGIWHVPVPRSGVTLVLRLGFESGGSALEEICRSTPVRLPPHSTAGPRFRPSAVALPHDVDLRRVMRNEGPVRPGHQPHVGELSPADRLRARLRFVRQEAEFHPPGSGPRRAAPPAAGGPAARDSTTGPGERPGGGDAEAGTTGGSTATRRDRADAEPRRSMPSRSPSPETENGRPASGRPAARDAGPRPPRATRPGIADPGPLPSSPRRPFGGGGRPSGEGRSR